MITKEEYRAKLLEMLEETNQMHFADRCHLVAFAIGYWNQVTPDCWHVINDLAKEGYIGY